MIVQDGKVPVLIDGVHTVTPGGGRRGEDRVLCRLRCPPRPPRRVRRDEMEPCLRDAGVRLRLCRGLSGRCGPDPAVAAKLIREFIAWREAGIEGL